MAKFFLKKPDQYTLKVYNRTQSKTDNLVKQGATLADSPRDCAKDVDVLIMMLGFPIDVENIVFNAEYGILSTLKEGAYLIDHTTSAPSLAIKIHAALKEKNCHSIDAPVSGGDIGAINGKLVTMIGGDKEAVDAVIPLMDEYSQDCRHMGGPGAGQHTKMANQVMIATTMCGLCEALIYGHKAGLDLSQLIDLLKNGAAGSFSLEKLGPRMIKRNFDPGFYVEHFVKDLGIALDESKRMGIAMPSAALAQQFYHALVA